MPQPARVGDYTRGRIAWADSLADVSDGTSNTLLFGEGVGGTTLGAAWTWMGFGAIGTSKGFKNQSQLTFDHFASRHPAVVQFCFADGSVRGLRREGTRWDLGTFSAQGIPAPDWPFPEPRSPWYVLQQLAGMRDGDALDPSPLLD